MSFNKPIRIVGAKYLDDEFGVPDIEQLLGTPIRYERPASECMMLCNSNLKMYFSRYGNVNTITDKVAINSIIRNLENYIKYSYENINEKHCKV